MLELSFVKPDEVPPVLDRDMTVHAQENAYV
jgi:hypothetical protein